MEAPTVSLNKRLVEQMTAIRDAHGSFLRFHFNEESEHRPREMFTAGRDKGLIEWKPWLYRDGDEWWEARLTDAGKAALEAFEAP